MTTLNSEEITLSSDSVDQAAFESQWQHWTVKRSLCPLLLLMGGDICLWVSITTLNSEEITLSSDSVEWEEGYICLWVSMTTLNSKEITLSSAKLTKGGYLPLSVNDNIEQWREHSVLCYCYQGGYICLWVSMTTLNSKEITLSSAKLTKGGYLPLSLNDNIEQWREHSVLCWCWMGGRYICLWVSMITLNSEEITLSSDSVDFGGISAFECQWQHWSVNRSPCPLLVLTRWGLGGVISAFESQWQHWTVKRSLCPLIVLYRGYIYLWVSMTTLNSKEITLSSDSIEQGVYICLWVSMTTLNSEEITLSSDSVEWGKIAIVDY